MQFYWNRLQDGKIKEVIGLDLNDISHQQQYSSQVIKYDHLSFLKLVSLFALILGER
jgi:hypothetical protein